MARISENVLEFIKINFKVENGKLYRKMQNGSAYGLRGEWIEPSNRYLNDQGYALLKICKKYFRYHRILWLCAHGSLDDKLEIDHINGIRNDNRLENLRQVTKRQNSHNLQIHRAGRLVGAKWDKSRNKWTAGMHIGNKYKNLGRFDSEIEAHKVYIKECKRLKLF